MPPRRSSTGAAGSSSPPAPSSARPASDGPGPGWGQRRGLAGRGPPDAGSITPSVTRSTAAASAAVAHRGLGAAAPAAAVVADRTSALAPGARRVVAPATVPASAEPRLHEVPAGDPER